MSATLTAAPPEFTRLLALLPTDGYREAAEALAEKNGAPAATEDLRQLLEHLGISTAAPAESPAAAFARMFPAPVTAAQPPKPTAKARARIAWKGLSVDAAGSTWKARRNGNVNATIKGYGRVPEYAIPLLVLLPKQALVVYFVVCCEADRDWSFKAPVGWLKNKTGITRRFAQEALEWLDAANFITVVHQGGHKQGTVWALTPEQAFDAAGAVERLTALRVAKRQTTDKVVETLASRRQAVSS